ncbi:hypothetical protein [Streptomyces sp. WZ-12]|uniref:hypothetical protein n=1 Tax=Streptomyces sp. WZ-12 TaxID=3030210 RepID=UPI0023810618|nr:hypothetical protein [Streptomyces sp. WZ-12]
MSHSQAALRRPGTLVAAVACSVASALAAFAGALVVLTRGRGLAAENIEQLIRDAPEEVGLRVGTTPAAFRAMSGPLWDGLVDDRSSTLLARGVLAAVLGLCLLVFGLYAGQGAVWARVLVTVCAVLAAPMHALVWCDHAPTALLVPTLLAPAAALAAVVLAWLPPAGRYAAQRKERKRNAAVPQPTGAVSA